MKVLKQIFVCALLLLMLFSSLGISFYLHDCHCRHKMLISLEVGFSEHETVHCCTSCEAEPAKNSDHISISRKGCCQDYVFFYLLPVTKDNVTKQLAHPFVNQIFRPITSVNNTAEFSLTGETVPFLHSPPLLQPGRKMIHLFQQIKIPFPSCLVFCRTSTSSIF